jgi:glycosyltransferase involved in cell wall biosynthesis
MRILFCSINPLRTDLGAPKVLIEVAGAMERLGCECTLIDADALVPGASSRPWDRVAYTRALRAHLAEHAGRFHAVEYDHVHLPFARREFAARTLFVARSVLLIHHFTPRPYPVPLRARVGELVRRERRREHARAVDAATRTVREADVVNVANDDDRTELVRRGVEPERIAVLPYGLAAERRRALEVPSAPPPAEPVVGFVGSFDYRKGALDFPRIVRAVAAEVPAVRFRLVGTNGLMRSAEQVLGRFPAELRGRVEVIPSFAPDELPGLLRDVSVGIFPSYVEGFGIGVLEMLAASVPVVAYRAPGPPMMLPPELLVEPGRAEEAGARVAALLRDRERLWEMREWARHRAADFDWSSIARDTLARYEQARARLG